MSFANYVGPLGKVLSDPGRLLITWFVNELITTRTPPLPLVLVLNLVPVLNHALEPQ